MSDTGGDSGLVLTSTVSTSILTMRWREPVQVRTVLDGDCQPCGVTTAAALNAHVNLDVRSRRKQSGDCSP